MTIEDACRITTQVDKLDNHLNHPIKDHGLVDMAPISLNRTWRNNWLGYDSVSKRIDRFLVSSQVLQSIDRFRTWVLIVGLQIIILFYFKYGMHRKQANYPFQIQFRMVGRG